MFSGERVEMQPVSPNVMMSALKIPECSLTIRSIGGKTLITEAPSVQVLSSSSKGDDYNFDHEPTPSDASKFSHIMEREMPVASPETELPLGETATTEGILFYPNHRFSFPSYRSCFSTCLYDIRRGCRY